MSGPLVRIRSYLTVYEAEWQRSRLTEAGIVSGTDNCAMVLWFWHYSQAMGGVKLYVDGARLDEATVLLDRDTQPVQTSSEPQPTVRSCLQCGAELAPDWDVCWRCARAPDANDDLDAIAVPQSAIDDREYSRAVVAAVATLLLAWTAISHGLVIGVGLLAVVVAARLLFGQATAGEEPPTAEVGQAAAEPSDLPRRASLAEAVALRAWQSAMMGLLSFPPLSFYALYLLVRLRSRRFELTPLAQAHRWGAIVSLLAAVGAWGIVLVSLSSGEIFYSIDWARMRFRQM